MEKVIFDHLKKLAVAEEHSFVIGYCSMSESDTVLIVDGGIELEQLSSDIWELVKEWL